MCRNGYSSSGAVRWICRENEKDSSRTYCYSTVRPYTKRVNTQAGKEGATHKPPTFTRTMQGASRFIVTAAQNATPVHSAFFSALVAACKELDAELVVIPLRYKNPTSKWSESQANEEWWAPELTPYLFNQRRHLNKNLVLLGDIKTVPTAESPLTGFEGITHGESGIFGHMKMQLRSVPTPQSKLPKLLTTTGALTVKNYTDSKAGKKGEFHHVLGACMVEIDGSIFHMRQLNAMADGSFIDLDRQYFASKPSEKAPRALALVMGDTHVRFTDKAVTDATFTGPSSIVETLDPQTLVFHDLLDGYAVNPHHRKAADPFLGQAKFAAGLTAVRAEVVEAVEFLEHRTGQRRSIVVPSNHNDFLRRWLIDHDWRKDPLNADFYLQTALALVRSARMTNHGATYTDPFAHWIRYLCDHPGVRVLTPDESVLIGGIEVGMHGEHGPNGARGSLKNLSTLGVKAITGHSHSPGIESGHYKVGTSTALKAEYTQGPSSWMNTHAVIYANSKRSLIHIVDGKWRLKK